MTGERREEERGARKGRKGEGRSEEDERDSTEFICMTAFTQVDNKEKQTCTNIDGP